MSAWTLADAYELLAVAQSFDRRTVGDFDAEGWRRAMHGLALEDCKQAIVEHYTTSTDWLMPAHIRQGVMRIRRDRLDRAQDYEPPDADPDDPIAYQRALIDGRRRTADGTEKPRDMQAIEGTFPSPPPVDVSTWRQRAQRMLPARRPAPADLSHSQAIADMDRLQAEQVHRDLERMAQARAELAGRESVGVAGEGVVEVADA